MIQLSIGSPFVMMLNTTANICHILIKKFNDPLSTIAIRDVALLLNLQKCPIKKVYEINFFYLRIIKHILFRASIL